MPDDASSSRGTSIPATPSTTPKESSALERFSFGGKRALNSSDGSASSERPNSAKNSSHDASPGARRSAARTKMIEEDTGPLGVLILHIHSATNLVATDRQGLLDPFVVARLGSTKLTGRKCWRTLDPVWNEEHKFPGYLSDLVAESLDLRVFTLERFGASRPLGRLRVSIDDLLRQRNDRRSQATVAQLHFEDVPLEGVAHGTISFSVGFELKFSSGIVPAAPVHASAAQALRRPPPADANCLERSRDHLLLMLCHPIWMTFAVAWIVALLASGTFIALAYGAIFVPQLLAWIGRTNGGSQTGKDVYAIGMSDADLELWANLCIQVLTALFSYVHIVAFPWRLSIAWHMVDRRSSAPGRDFYGRKTEAIWFHIPTHPRNHCGSNPAHQPPTVQGLLKGPLLAPYVQRPAHQSRSPACALLCKGLMIIALLFIGTIFHFATQTCRFVYYSYELSNTLPVRSSGKVPITAPDEVGTYSCSLRCHPSSSTGHGAHECDFRARHRVWHVGGNQAGQRGEETP